MYQEAEQGIWKPVLGALGAASVILTIVGNLVFTSNPSSLPVLKMAGAEFDKPARSDTNSATQTDEVRRIEAAPAIHTPSKTHETIVTVPRAIRQVEAPNAPCDTANEMLLADQSPPVQPGSQRDVEIATPTVDAVPLPHETQSPIVLAERAAVVETEVPAGPTLPASDTVAASSVASVPVIGPEVAEPIADHPIANHDSADNIRPEPAAIAFTEVCGPRPNAADAPSPIQCYPIQCFTAQKLSHYERKMLRKIAHLERKKNRLFKDDCALVSR